MTEIVRFLKLGNVILQSFRQFFVRRNRFRYLLNRERLARSGRAEDGYGNRLFIVLLLSDIQLE
jgi:hypothetical protein